MIKCVCNFLKELKSETSQWEQQWDKCSPERRQVTQDRNTQVVGPSYIEQSSVVLVTTRFLGIMRKMSRLVSSCDCSTLKWHQMCVVRVLDPVSSPVGVIMTLKWKCRINIRVSRDARASAMPSVAFAEADTHVSCWPVRDTCGTSARSLRWRQGPLMGSHINSRGVHAAGGGGFGSGGVLVCCCSDKPGRSTCQQGISFRGCTSLQLAAETRDRAHAQPHLLLVILSLCDLLRFSVCPQTLRSCMLLCLRCA